MGTESRALILREGFPARNDSRSNPYIDTSGLLPGLLTRSRIHPDCHGKFVERVQGRLRFR